MPNISYMQDLITFTCRQGAAGVIAPGWTRPRQVVLGWTGLRRVVLGWTGLRQSEPGRAGLHRLN